MRRLVTNVPLGWLALAASLVLLLGTAAARTAATRKARRANATYTVTATAYEAVVGQTDSKPFITADNSRIPRGYGSHTRWLALSRDLLRPWGGPFEFGDKVRVEGISPALDGVYTVHDTMNRRYRHRLDVLAHPRERISINQPGVRLRRVSSANRTSPLRARRAGPVVVKATLAHRKAQPRRTRALVQQRHAPPRKLAKQPATRPQPSARANKPTRLAKRPAAHSRLAARPAKPARAAKHPASLAHQKHGVAKKQLATLPKRAKKRIVAQVHHLPAA